MGFNSIVPVCTVPRKYPAPRFCVPWRTAPPRTRALPESRKLPEKRPVVVAKLSLKAVGPPVNLFLVSSVPVKVAGGAARSLPLKSTRRLFVAPTSVKTGTLSAGLAKR